MLRKILLLNFPSTLFVSCLYPTLHLVALWLDCFCFDHCALLPSFYNLLIQSGKTSILRCILKIWGVLFAEQEAQFALIRNKTYDLNHSTLTWQFWGAPMVGPKNKARLYWWIQHIVPQPEQDGVSVCTISILTQLCWAGFSFSESIWLSFWMAESCGS